MLAQFVDVGLAMLTKQTIDLVIAFQSCRPLCPHFSGDVGAMVATVAFPVLNGHKREHVGYRLLRDRIKYQPDACYSAVIVDVLRNNQRHVGRSLDDQRFDVHQWSVIL